MSQVKTEFVGKFDIIATLDPENPKLALKFQNFGSINKAKKEVRKLQAGNKVGRVRVVQKLPPLYKPQEIKP